jgi:hypothetical protein
VANEPGFPDFRYNQWTVEGEIERFGALGRAGARSHGPKRWFVIFVLAVVLLTAVGGVLTVIV